MTEQYWPFDSGAGADVYENRWSEMFDLVLSTGVFRGVTNELEVYADSSGMQVKIKTGKAWMKGHFYKNDAEVIKAIATAHATLNRIDRVVLRLDWTANTIALAVLTGTAAGSPTAPALTQNTAIWEISLAQVLVDAAVSTIAAGKVTDERVFTDGENWTAPPLLNSWADYGGSTYAPAGYYKDERGRVHIRGLVKNGTNPAVVFTLPAGYRPEYVVVLPEGSNGNALSTGRIEVRQNGDVYFTSASGSTAVSLDIPSFRAYQ